MPEGKETPSWRPWQYAMMGSGLAGLIFMTGRGKPEAAVLGGLLIALVLFATRPKAGN